MAQDENASFSADLSADVSVLLNLDLSGVIAASTPKRSRRGRAAANAKQQSPFKKPNKAPRKLGPVLATCDLCGAQYRTLKYYLLHRDGHKLKGYLWLCASLLVKSVFICNTCYKVTIDSFSFQSLQAESQMWKEFWKGAENWE